MEINLTKQQLLSAIALLPPFYVSSQGAASYQQRLPSLNLVNKQYESKEVLLNWEQDLKQREWVLKTVEQSR